MRLNGFPERLFGLVLLSLLAGCPPEETADPSAPLGDGFAAVVAVDARTVILALRRPVDRDSAQVGAFTITDFTVLPPAPLTVLRVEISGDAELTLQTAEQVRGTLYTLRVNGLEDRDGFRLDGSINFTGGGAREKAVVVFRVADLELAAQYGALDALVTVDAEGRFDPDAQQRLAFVPAGSALTAELEIVVDRNRTADRSDDGDPVVDRRAYAVRVVDADDQAVSPLVTFAVPEADEQIVEIPLLTPRSRCPDAPVTELEPPAPPTDPSPGDGVAEIRFFIDDRQAGELVDPAISLTADAAGNFSLSEQRLALQDDDGDGVWEVAFALAVDPARINTDIATAPVDELPYIAFLVNAGVQLNDFFLFIRATDESPRTVEMRLGDPDLVPVTLRVDVGAAFLTADGSQRGIAAHEAVYITGNFVNIVDALRQNCADTWSGGENLNLRMRPHPSVPGVWQKTLWMPPGRTQTFKVLRCDAEAGCSALNTRVTSTGSAFATVGKNLTTENRDASEYSEVRVADPYQLESTVVGGQNVDYSGASIYQGDGVGREADPEGTPRTDLLFKQELPNLVVNLLDSGDCPAQTPVYVIGTWRDINLPMTPEEILASIEPGDTPFDLIPYDYDDGMIGVAPPIRELP